MAPPSAPHYELGQPYQAGGVWWYPSAALRFEETGIAEVYGADHPGLTADGEVFDQGAMAAANQTLSLPVIAQVTNLETGRQVLVRINDRGPPTPRRVLAVTRRVADLLGFPATGAARVRVRVLEAESQAAQAALPGAPSLPVSAAPRGAVESSSLAPPPGARGSAGGTGMTTAASTAPSAQQSVPLRLPETLTQTTPDPGQLWIDLGSFPTYEFANMRRADVAQLGATIDSSRRGRSESFRVLIGPIPDIPQADRLLDQTVAAGVPDGRIVVR
jgi:rare lipoprotein A